MPFRRALTRLSEAATRVTVRFIRTHHPGAHKMHACKLGGVREAVEPGTNKNPILKHHP